MINEPLAKQAYKAYGRTVDFKNVRGEPMPEWADLPDTIKQAWDQAATEVSLSSVQQPTKEQIEALQCVFGRPGRPFAIKTTGKELVRLLKRYAKGCKEKALEMSEKKAGSKNLKVGKRRTSSGKTSFRVVRLRHDPEKYENAALWFETMAAQLAAREDETIIFSENEDIEAYRALITLDLDAYSLLQ